MPESESYRPSRSLRSLRTPRWSTRSTLRTATEWGALSSAGRVRSTNEDCFFVGRFDRTLETVLTNTPAADDEGWHHEAGYVVIVADGIGGRAAGQVASQMAVGTLVELALDTPDWIMRFDEKSLIGRIGRQIERRLQHIDHLLASVGRKEPALAGMGTTVTVLALLPPHGLVAHVGDSRAYVRQRGKLSRLTRDHTAAQALADAGLIDPADVAQAPKCDLLTRAAGHGAGKLVVDVERVRVELGDQVLLCTNGLTGVVGDEDINRVLATSVSAATACQTLVHLALERGGPDNITVVVGRLAQAPR